MKRLITIFVSLIIGITMWSQNLPMTIVGDVYIADNGQMLSEGPVHLQALSQDSVAKVANYGVLNMMDSVIFYSNDSIEGLLMNQNTAASPVTAKYVVLRKVFTNGASGVSGYKQIAFPFDVDIANITDQATGKTLVRGTDYQANFYDGQYRATNGSAGDQNWRSLDNMTGGAPTVLSKGVGYEVSVRNQYSVVDFPATSATTITDLFANQVKGISLAYDTCPPGKFIDTTMVYSEGWNAIGGLNSTNYVVSGANVNYGNLIYYRNPNGAYNDWSYLYPGDPTDIGTLRPYAVMFVQTNSATPLVYSTTGTGGFGYGVTGLTLDTVSSVFRSSLSSSPDLYKMLLTQDNNNSFSKIYLQFDDTYSQSFRASEGDAVPIETASASNPMVWAYAPAETSGNNIMAVVDCLPYNDNEVPLGVNFPATGNYTFSLQGVTVNTDLIKSATLLDKTNNTTTDLLQSNYSFQANSTVTLNADGTVSSTPVTDRFVLFINKAITSIDQIATSEIYAYAENNTITVMNLNTGDKVQILDLTGRIIASGVATSNTYSSQANQKGVYIVSVKGVKTATLKVLNK